MSIRSKFPGVCRNCNGRFDAGTLIEWSKGAGSSHVTCPAKSAAPKAPSARPAPVVKVDATVAPFESSEKWEPCKRPSLDRQLISCIGEMRRYAKRGPYLRQAVGADRQAPTGLYVVMGTDRGRFESSEDNEDMGDMSGAGWHVVVYMRAATEEEIVKDNNDRVGRSIPEIFAALARMVYRCEERRAREAMDAAAHREGWGRVALARVDALGPEVIAARKATTRRLWTSVGNDHSYVSAFEHQGATIYESHQYVYDWDQPTIFVAPLEIVARAELAQAITGWGYALSQIERAQIEAARKAVDLAKLEAKKLPAGADLAATFGIELDTRAA